MAAFIYDKNKQKILLISDRHGLYYNYYYKNEDDFIFAPEVKCFLTLNNINKKINPMAFDCFMELGYIVGDNTWFEKIKLQNPSSILIYDIKTKELSKKLRKVK